VDRSTTFLVHDASVCKIYWLGGWSFIRRDSLIGRCSSSGSSHQRAKRDHHHGEWRVFHGGGTVSANGIAVGPYAVGYAPIQLTSIGSFVVNDIWVQSPGLGAKTVGVTDSKGLYGSAIFTVTQPAITLNSLTAPIGETITGAGWLPLSAVVITLRSNNMAIATVTAISDFNGGIDADFKLPNRIGIGAKVVSFHAADASGFGNVALAQELEVPAPNVTLSTTEAEVGTIVTLTATGFRPNTAVTAFTIGAWVSYKGLRSQIRPAA